MFTSQFIGTYAETPAVLYFGPVKDGCAHPSRRQRSSIQCDSTSRRDTLRENMPADVRSAVRTAMAVAIVSSTLSAAVAPQAQAREWRPRRHHRTLKDEVLNNARAIPTKPKEVKKAVVHQTAPAASEGAVDSVVKSAQRAYRKLQRTVQGETVYSVGISGRQNPTASYYGATSSSPEASPAGWIAAGIAAAGLAYVVWGRSVRWPWASKRRGEGGRWVRDRSLGGKMVFIPNGAAGTSTTRPLWEDDDEFSSELVTAAASGAVSAVSAGASTDATPQELVPEWWSPPSSASYVSAGRKEELHKQAKAALRQLEDAKMLRGEDYSLSGMVALRSLCSQAGGLQVRAHTESGRDAILRAAVRAAINASLRSSNPASALGGYEPGRFVSGLAHDLAVPDKRAVTIVHAEVAATCRGALIDAEAAYRIGSQDDLVRALQRLVVCLGAFPLPPGSPEAELVGRSFVKHATLEFRKAVFMGAGSYDLAVAPLVAEMLGFDPQLVMPQLLTQVAAMTQAGQASQPPATQE